MKHRRDIRKSNRNFMIGTACMAVMVILVVLLFWYWCLPVK